jgi:putative transposase
MTDPRSEVFHPEEIGDYHCISRCVRRAFLCGDDSYSGKNYEHRRAWVRERLGFLVEIFAVDLIAYAVMSNHFHCVIRNRPDVAAGWTPQEVAIRWRKLYPLQRWKRTGPEPTEEEIFPIINSPELVEEYRRRLASISWFMGRLCEYIARRANAEDECKGRFWEGRFTSKRILNPSAVVVCSAYVDLNPVRAGIARDLDSSNYTSIQDRIRHKEGRVRRVSPRLTDLEDATYGEYQLDSYIRLLEYSGGLISSSIDISSADLNEFTQQLTALEIQEKEWLALMAGGTGEFKKVVGTEGQIRQFAKNQDKSWFWGISIARKRFA